MKTIKRTVLALITVLSVGTISAQEVETAEVAEKKLTITGSVDTYYQSYLSASDDAGQSFGTAFAGNSGFAVGMGNVVFAYDGEKVGAVLDLVTGPRGASATFSDNIVDGIVNQAYVYYNISDKTTLTMGRFNTFLGYEVISPVANFNYSTSYLFSNGPFSHVGVKADFALTEDFSLMLAVTNPWDTNDTSMTGEYALGLQLGYKGQYLNLYNDSGANGGLGFEIDYTGGFDLSDSIFLGINAAYNDNDGSGFYGAAIYPQLAASESFSVGLRGEYFAYTYDAADDSTVFAATLTGSYTVEDLTIKPELRLDTWGDAEPYVDADGMASKNLSSFLIAAIYSF